MTSRSTTLSRRRTAAFLGLLNALCNNRRGVEASGGIQASHGVAKSAPTTPPIRCRSSSPGPVQTRCEAVPSMNGDLHVPDAHTRDEAQAVGGGQHDPRTSPAPSRALPFTTAIVCTQTIAPDQMLACGDVRALTAGRLRTPSWGQHFEIRGSGPQAKVHSCIVSHIVDLRAFYGDIAAADVLGASLRCLHLFESALGLADSMVYREWQHGARQQVCQQPSESSSSGGSCHPWTGHQDGRER